MSMLTNPETTQQVIKLGCTKASYPFSKTLLLGVMGGLFIALAALGNMLALHHIGGGVGKLVGACLFPTGLMLTVLVGGSLFTGDALGTLALVQKQSKVAAFLRGIVAVWLGNFIGAASLAYVSYVAGSYHAEAFVALLVDTAEQKLHLGVAEAIASGFLCNALVAIAVWMALATNTLGGKILAIFFPICLFVFCGFQHVVANMYYVNVGLILEPDLWNTASYSSHFLWVTVGNFLSGGVFLPLIYKVIYLK